MRIRVRRLFALAILASFTFAACSGGGGVFNPPALGVSATPTPSGPTGNIATTITQGGSIQLPGAAPGLISGFSINNSLGTVPVRGNGTFSLTAFTGAQLATVTNPRGNPEMMGLLGPSETQINARTTAEALIYFNAGLFMLPTDQRQQVYESIASTSGFAAVETAVTTTLAADPDALVDGNPAISGAVRTFIAALPTPAVAFMQVTPKDILVQEPSKGSGVTVLNAQPVQIAFMNEKRRMARAYVDQVSVARSDGTNTQIIDFPVSNIVPPVEIAATNSLKTFTGTVTDIFSGNYAWNPVTTDAIALSPVANSVWTRYKVTVVGEGVGVAAGLTTEQQGGLVSMRLQNFLWNMALPALSGLVLPYNKSPFGGTLSSDDAGVLKGLVDEVSSDVPSITPTLANGDYKGALLQIVSALGNNAPFKNFVLRLIAKKVGLDAADTQSLLEKGGDTAVLKAVDGILTGIDLAAAIKDALSAHPVEVFTVYLVPTKFLITPASATLGNNQSIHFNVNVPSASGSGLALAYQWQSTANNGHLTPLSNKCTGQDNFTCSAGDDVIYKSNSQGSGSDRLTVTLQGFDSSGDKIQKIDLGSANVTVTVTSTPSPTPSPTPDPGSFGTPPTDLPQSRCAGLAVDPHQSHVGSTITGTVSYAGDLACGGDLPEHQRPTWFWSGQSFQVISGCTANSLSCVFQGVATGSPGNRYVRLCLNGNSRQGAWISCDYYGVAP